MIGDLFLRLGIIYALILIGVILKRSTELAKVLTKAISIFLIYFSLPVVIFTSIAQFSEAFSDLRILIFSASIFFISSIVAYILFRILKERGTDSAPFVLTSINPNGFYLPFPIVYALYDMKGLTYSSVYLLTANIINASYIYPLYSYYSNSDKRKSVALTRKILLFPPFLASILGFVFLGLGLPFPEQLTQPISYFGQFTTYVALLFVGLSTGILREGWFSKSTLGVVSIRLVMVPLMLFGLMKFLGLREIWSQVIIIHSGMPPAVNNIILADHFNLDRKRVAAIVTEATALSLLTLPLLLYLVNNL